MSDGIEKARSVKFDDVVENTIHQIEAESNGDFVGLRSRFPNLNKTIKRYFRPNNIYTIAGASGAGKSYLLTMLKVDFTSMVPLSIDITDISDNTVKKVLDSGNFFLQGNSLIRPALNKQYADAGKKVVILDFSLEMSQEASFIRTLANLSYNNTDYITSSLAGNEFSSDGDYTYQKIEKSDLHFIKKLAVEYKNTISVTGEDNKKLIQYIPFKGPITVNGFINTCLEAKERYPDRQIIILYDHTLLTDSEDSDQKIQDKFIKKAINVRDETDAIMILLSQMNSNIEDDKRRQNPNLHYPTKKDIYEGGQLYQGSDFVFTMFMPHKIGINSYGPYSIKAKNIIHLGNIKNRYGTQTNLWFINDLDKGEITPGKLEKVDNAGEITPYKDIIKVLVDNNQTNVNNNPKEKTAPSNFNWSEI